MTRFARPAILCAISLLAGAGAAAAQTGTSTIPGSDQKYAVDVNTAATLGHTSNVAFGAEFDYRYNVVWDLFVSYGHIGNVATSDFDARAQVIANAVGASASSSEKVNFLDVGGRYRFPVGMKFQPYAEAGIGLAHVSTNTTFGINGTSFSAEDLGIALGTDLRGTFTEPFFELGIGGDYYFAKKYFVDLSYRYGHIKGSSQAGDVVLDGINTQRVQVGVGLVFNSFKF
jgi:opacity protein-like surface antigen